MMGYRFRLHGRDLPGAPDIVLPRHKKVVFVHGCFWHSHGCPKGKRPTSHTSFWSKKLDGNRWRDHGNVRQLKQTGWSVLVVWECQLRDAPGVVDILAEFLHDGRKT